MTKMRHTALGANGERTRAHNRKMVLGRLRAAGQLGRAEIARSSGLSIQAVSNIIADLVDDGLIVRQGRRAAGRGQPPIQYALNPGGACALGIEVRPDAVFAAILNLGGETMAADRQSLSSVDRDTIADAVTSLRDALTERVGALADTLLGAGVVMPGPFGRTGLQGSESELPIWEDVAPDAWFGDLLGLPVVIENDANAAAVAERISGVAQGLETYAFLYFGSGLGLGAVQRGRLMHGAFGNAGEIGHIPVPSSVGMVALESRVSRLSVQRALASSGIQVSSGEDLEELYRKQDPTMLRWLDTAVIPLSAAIAVIENLFDPETIILGGAMPDALLDHLVSTVPLPERSVAQRRDRAIPRMMRGASGRMTATLGAAALVINQSVTPTMTV